MEAPLNGGNQSIKGDVRGGNKHVVVESFARQIQGFAR